MTKFSLLAVVAALGFTAAAHAESATYVIDPAKCTECEGFFDSPHCVSVCPVANCCVPDPQHPARVN